MRGKKGTPHREANDPPRRRANKRRGHGTYKNDRPPIVQIISRQTQQVRLWVVERSDRQTLERLIGQAIPSGSDVSVNTDEWRGYLHISQRFGIRHQTVCHAHNEWARDDDGDGIREVHCNSCEGNGAALRTYLRRFRGVHKRYLQQYCSSYQFMFNAKRISPEIIRDMCCHANLT